MESKELTDAEQLAEYRHNQELQETSGTRALKIIIFSLVMFIVCAVGGALVRYGADAVLAEKVLDESPTVLLGAVGFTLLLIVGYANRK